MRTAMARRWRVRPSPVRRAPASAWAPRWKPAGRAASGSARRSAAGWGRLRRGYRRRRRRRRSDRERGRADAGQLHGHLTLARARCGAEEVGANADRQRHHALVGGSTRWPGTGGAEREGADPGDGDGDADRVAAGIVLVDRAEADRGGRGAAGGRSGTPTEGHLVGRTVAAGSPNRRRRGQQHDAGRHEEERSDDSHGGRVCVDLTVPPPAADPDDPEVLFAAGTHGGPATKPMAVRNAARRATFLRVRGGPAVFRWRFPSPEGSPWVCPSSASKTRPTPGPSGPMPHIDQPSYCR